MPVNPPLSCNEYIAVKGLVFGLLRLFVRVVVIIRPSDDAPLIMHRSINSRLNLNMTRRTGKISTTMLPLYLKFLMILAIIQVFILINYVITEDEVLLLTEEGTNKSVPEYLENSTEDRHIEEEFVKGCKCVQCKEDEVCGGLWKADRLPTIDHDKDYTDPHSLKIHIVVSHCKSDLHWMSKFIKGYEHSIVSTHIITKCGAPIHGAPEGATIQELPNVGRCDHTYAYYINNILDQKVKKGEENDSIVFFLKDDMSSENMHQGSVWNKFDSMVQLASSDNGFACGAPPWDSAYHNSYEESCSCSAYHDPNLLTFTIEEYDRNIKGYDDNGVDFMSENYPNLGSFYNHLDSEKALPMPKLVQVCYGGIFAASVNNLKRTDDSIWKMAEESLTRGNNIHEGHYMERLWGHLMSKPLEQYQIDAIKNHANDNYVKQPWFKGMLCKGGRHRAGHRHLPAGF